MKQGLTDLSRKSTRIVSSHSPTKSEDLQRDLSTLKPDFHAKIIMAFNKIDLLPVA